MVLMQYLTTKGTNVVCSVTAKGTFQNLCRVLGPARSTQGQLLPNVFPPGFWCSPCSLCPAIAGGDLAPWESAPQPCASSWFDLSAEARRWGCFFGLTENSQSSVHLLNEATIDGRNKFSVVSVLVNLLCKATIETNFENVHTMSQRRRYLGSRFQKSVSHCSLQEKVTTETYILQQLLYKSNFFYFPLQ